MQRMSKRKYVTGSWRHEEEVQKKLRQNINLSVFISNEVSHGYR